MSVQAENLGQPQASATSSSGSTGAPSRQEQSQGIIRRNAYWALGLGLLPIPLVDLLALTAVQIKMLKEISALYNVNFFEDKAKAIVGSLVASLGSLSLTATVASSLFKVVPFVGQLVGAVGVPILAGALTVAVGNLFVMHYESGGTLLNFDVEKMKAHFHKEFDKAKEAVKEMQKDPNIATGESIAP